MSRLPIRARLTLAFAGAMALVLVGVGVFLYVRLGTALEEQLDESLELRAATISQLVRSDGEPGAGGDESIVQLYRPDRPPRERLISDAEAARAASSPFLVSRDGIGALEGERVRLLVTAVAGDVLVVGTSLEDQEEALAKLLAQLVVVGPLALLLSTFAGYLLAGAAFRPVEEMRRRASRVSSESVGQRLPLPPARDEIHRLGETLNAMLGRLEAGFVRERRFIADASHELRTPLALLRTELELALRRPRTHEELEQALASALDEVDRTTRLAEDLLVLARVDEGGLPLRREPASAEELLEAVARRFSARAATEGRQIDVGATANEALVVDRLRLEQALGNLVDNALRHGAGTVRLAAVRGPGTTELRVSDGGTGFPAGFLPRAFERFARADEARGGGSTGLGLAIVDAIARAHGGTTRAANRPDGGADVWITLPTTAA